jgi:hypothetical protein
MSQSSFTEINQKYGLITTAVIEGGQAIRFIERGDLFDVLGLVLFAGTFASLTFGFTSLGIHTYQKSQP